MVEYIRLAAFFAAGIYLSDRIAPSFTVIFILSLILVLTIKSLFKHKFNVNIFIMALAFVMGVCLCGRAQNAERYKLSEFEGRYVTVTGRVSEIPYPTDGENTQYVVKIRELTHKNETRRINEKLLITTSAGFKYGDTVTSSGFISNLPKKMNENGYDFARYYKSKKIFFKMYSSKTEYASYKIHDYSPYSLGLYLKCFVSDAIEKRYKGDFAAILKAVLTGNKKEFSPEFTTVLERTGLKRFYYPAFLHVMLLMSLIAAVLGAFERKKREIVTVFLLIIYALFNSSNSVFLKLCILLALLIVLKMRYGHVYYLDAIGMTALIMGVINPQVYYDVGFVLSILSSILIYYFYDSVEKLIKFIKPKYVRRLMAIGIICNIGLIPVMAYFWNTVTLHSIFVSFIMLPCVTVILVLSPATVPLLGLFGKAPVFGWITTAMTAVLYYIPILADKLTFLGQRVNRTDILDLLIYFFIMVALVKLIKKKKRHAYAALFVAAALCTSAGINEVMRHNDLELTFVNVGQGDGAIITAPHRFNILIDGGGGNAYSDYNPGEKLFLEYLRTENITTIDSAFVSHYHKDHAQGIVAAIENLRVRNVFMPDSMEGSEWRTALEDAAKANGTKIHYLTDEVLLRYNNGMTIRVIPPAKKTAISDDENDTTFVYYVTYGDFSAMYTGDMSRFAERNLLEGGKVPHADLLKVTHHGSKSGSSKEWIEAVNPLYSVISVGENNTYYLPNEETLENLSGTILYRTDYDGDVRFVVEKDGVKDIDIFNRRKQ